MSTLPSEHSVVHQENNMITKVTSIPPCPCSLLILIKKKKNLILGAAVAHRELFQSPAHGTSCPMADLTEHWARRPEQVITSQPFQCHGWVILHLARKTLGFSHLVLQDFLGILWEVNTLTSHCIMDWYLPELYLILTEIFLMFLCQSKLVYLSEQKKLRLSRFGIFFFPFVFLSFRINLQSNVSWKLILD